jgi:hypothetical protein
MSAEWGHLTTGEDDVDIGLDGEDQWWFNLRTQQVERGPGAPNAERMGPYSSEHEAAEALERARLRAEAWDAEDEEG